MTARGRDAGRPRSWPRWLEPLRPDQLTRRRLRGRVHTEARPILRRLRRGELWEVASEWTSTLAPLAAALALVLGWLALRAPPPRDPDPPLRVESLAGPASGESPPQLLTEGAEPSAETVLSAVLHDGR